MSNATNIADVRREVTVEASAERAFDVFTRRLDAWWPHESHHVGPMPAIAVLEPRVDGRCYSLSEDGTQTDWGRVLVFDPPRLLRFAWLLTPDWQCEPDPERASDVTVTFETLSPSRTRVVLVHGGFDRYVADGAETMRDQVDGAGGWGALLELYAGEVAAAG
jgi:uncharacterized protein YndB with AHSA1/START domain